MKNIITLLLLYTFLISGCCSYCASAGSTEIIGITLYDKDTGNLIQDNLSELNFQLKNIIDLF